jgi:DNA modification methylase
MNWKDILPKENRYFETENGILYCGDCLEIMKKFPKKSIDLVVTDPPYGVNFQNSKFYDDSKDAVFSQNDKWLHEMYRVLKDTSHIYMFIPTLEVDKWVSGVKKYFSFNNLLAFQTHNTNRYIKNNFSFDLQLVIYVSKGDAKRLNKVDWIPTSEAWLKDKRNKEKKPYTYKYPSFNKYFKANEKSNAVKKSLHPNQKSLELIEKFVLLSSNEGDVVLDPFIGSGKTAVACEKLNCRWIGIELNPEYCEIAKQRIKDTIKELKI